MYDLKRFFPIFPALFLLFLPLLSDPPALWAQEAGVEGEEGVEDLPFLKDKDEGNLAVDPAAVRPAGLEIYEKALFLFKNLRKGRKFWGRTTKSEGAGAHDHLAAMDGRGNGVTSPGPDGHVHEIRNGIVQDSGGHRHEMAGVKTPEACGLLEDRPYFFHVLGLTSPGGDGHRHTVVCYARGGVQVASSEAGGHRHLCKGYEIGKAFKRKGRRNVALPPDEAHTHEVRWIGRNDFTADACAYLSDRFEAAARKGGKFPQAHYYACICQQWMLEYGQALKTAKRAVQGLDDFHEAMVELGDINMWLGDYEKAYRQYERALSVSPGYGHAHFMEGMARLREGEPGNKFKKAEAAFRAAQGQCGAKARTDLDFLREKAREHLSPDKRAAFEAFADFLLEGDPKEMGKARKEAEETLSGRDKAWLDRAQEDCSEYIQSSYWLKEIAKERVFPGWEDPCLVESDHYIVKTQGHETLAEFISGQLESAYKLYMMMFSLKLPQKVKVNVYIYPDHKAYVKDGAPAASGGYSNPYFKKLVWPVNQKDIQEGFRVGQAPTPEKLENTLLVLFHEAFHQYLDKFIANAPQCFNEGCADYFGPSLFRVRKVAGGWTGKLIVRKHSWRVPVIKQMIQHDIHLPLEPFWKMTKAEMYSRRYQGWNYAQAWAWVFFLAEKRRGETEWEEMDQTKKPKGKYARIFGNYYKALRKGKGLNEAWEDSFGRLGSYRLRALEKEWKDFIMGLK